MKPAPEEPISGEVYAEALHGGFRRLRFAPRLEHEFTEEFAGQHATRMRIGFAVALVLYGCFVALRLAAESGTVRTVALELRLLSLGLIVLTLALSYVHRLRALLPILTLASYAGFAIGTTAVEVLAQRHGVDRHYEGLILVSFHVYVFSGLLFRPALLAGGFILACYGLGGAIGGLASKAWAYQLLFIALTQLIGASALYAIEHIERDNFLRRRMLTLFAARDGLTGLYNRVAFFQQLERAVRHAAREGRAIGVVLLDVDHFKAFNDRYGHLEGDACLRAVAAAVSDAFKRPLDAAGRYGGEEFVGVWHDIQPQALRGLAEQLRASVQALRIAHRDAPSGRVTVSVGAVACVPQEGESLQGLIHRADTALYEAKEKGRNRIVVEILPSAVSPPLFGERRTPPITGTGG